MRNHQTISQAFSCLQGTGNYTVALTIKPHNDGIISTEETLLSFLKSIRTGINKWMNGKHFDRNPHLDIPMAVVIEGDRYNRHLHISLEIEPKRIMRLFLLFHHDNKRNIVKRHGNTFTHDLKKIRDDGWLGYCSKFLTKPQDFDRVYFFGPSE